ncbi:MAG TPA: hypothetical protein EYO33_00955, partial [Phycisphaerales bacterium]|nr:hypothetical protein [Phycisphaerales bacterium]
MEIARASDGNALQSLSDMTIWTTVLLFFKLVHVFHFRSAAAIYCDSHAECDFALDSGQRYCDAHSGLCEICLECCQGEEFGIGDTCGSCVCSSSSSSHDAFLLEVDVDVDPAGVVVEAAARAALGQLLSLAPPPTTNNAHNHHCDWLHVTCNVHGLVVSIEARLANMTGSIPDIFGDLPDLEILDLGLNELTGVVPPSVGSLFRLRYFAVDFNKLVVDTSVLSSLTSLRTLKAQYNYEVASGLEPLAKLPKLRVVEL